MSRPLAKARTKSASPKAGRDARTPRGARGLRPSHCRAGLLGEGSIGHSATSGALYMCGTGEFHNLGLGDTKDRETPVLVEALPDWFYRGITLL